MTILMLCRTWNATWEAGGRVSINRGRLGDVIRSYKTPGSMARGDFEASGITNCALGGDEMYASDRGVKYDEAVLEAGLVALSGSESLQGAADGGYGDIGVAWMPELRLTFGSALCDRIGRRRRFFFTLLRSCSRASRSLEMSSEELSSSEISKFRIGTMGDVAGDDSSDESWRVSSKSTSSSPDSEKLIGDSASSSIAGPRFSLAKERLMLGGRNRFGGGIGV
jgi:hypothetical protein